MDNDVRQAIEDAQACGNMIRELYARLRLTHDVRQRGELLKQACGQADTLDGALKAVSHACGGNMPTDTDTRDALQALGGVMEQVMVAEREYRIAAGGDMVELSAGAEVPV